MLLPKFETFVPGVGRKTLEEKIVYKQGGIVPGWCKEHSALEVRVRIAQIESFRR